MDARSAALRRLLDRVAAAAEARTPLEIRGGGTKGFYGETPRGDVLDTRELQGITSYEPTELVITALAGTPLSELETTLASRGQCLSFEPPRFGAAGTVGGMVAAGLAGPARFSAGAVRDYVLGATVLNGAGELMTFGGQVMKNVAGYDLSRVYAGSLGILGILCEVSLKVMPVPPASATLIFDLEQEPALEQLHRWAGRPHPINATAWHAGRLWIRAAGARSAVAEARARLGGGEMEAAAAEVWWRDVRDQRHHFFSPPGAPDRDACLWRVSVPDTAAPLALAGEQFIEWGGAERWLRSTSPAAQIRAAAAAAGGHATLFRADDKSPGVFGAVSPPLLAIHRRLKQSFDPAGIFNPGRLYAEL